jgi:hypothetical protein
MDIQQQTKNVAAQGRFGDSMLLHVNPAEVKGLASAVPLTVNPETGQPEAFLPFLAPVLGSMLGGSLLTGATIGGLTLSAGAAAGLGAGLATYAQTGGSGSKALLSGLTAGLGTRALQGAAQGTQAGVDAAIATPPVDPSFVGPMPTPVAPVTPPVAPPIDRSITAGESLKSMFTQPDVVGQVGGFDAGMKSLAGAAMSPSGMAAGTAAGTAGVIASQEEFERQMAQLTEDEEERKRRMYEMYPEQIPGMKEGGRIGFYHGGTHNPRIDAQRAANNIIFDVPDTNYSNINYGLDGIGGGFNAYSTPARRTTRPIGRGFMPGFMPEYSYFENMNPSATSLGYDPLGNFQNPQSYQGGYSQPSRGRGGFGGLFGGNRGGYRPQPQLQSPMQPPQFAGYGNPFMQSPNYQGFYGVPQMQQMINPYAAFSQMPMPYQPYQPYTPPVETPPDDGGGTGGGTGGGGTPPIDPPIDIPGDGLGRKGAVTNPDPIAPPDDFVNPIVNPPVGGPVEPPITPPITMPPMPPSIGRPGEPPINVPGGTPGFYDRPTPPLPDPIASPPSITIPIEGGADVTIPDYSRPQPPRPEPRPEPRPPQPVVQPVPEPIAPPAIVEPPVITPPTIEPPMRRPEPPMSIGGPGGGNMTGREELALANATVGDIKPPKIMSSTPIKTTREALGPVDTRDYASMTDDEIRKFIPQISYGGPGNRQTVDIGQAQIDEFRLQKTDPQLFSQLIKDISSGNALPENYDNPIAKQMAERDQASRAKFAEFQRNNPVTPAVAPPPPDGTPENPFPMQPVKTPFVPVTAPPVMPSPGQRVGTDLREAGFLNMPEVIFDGPQVSREEAEASAIANGAGRSLAPPVQSVTTPQPIGQAPQPPQTGGIPITGGGPLSSGILPVANLPSGPTTPSRPVDPRIGAGIKIPTGPAMGGISAVPTPAAPANQRGNSGNVIPDNMRFSNQVMQQPKPPMSGGIFGAPMFAEGGDTSKELPNEGLKALAKTEKGKEAVEAMGYQEGGQTDMMQDPVTQDVIMFILGETDNENAINAFVEKYGAEQFMFLRDKILKQAAGNPDAQTEGLIQGNGNSGMADDLPGVIGNKEKIAVSQDEFIVPADVVSMLGDGSSDAGSKQLYNMMDRVRQAKTGGTTQAPPLNPQKVLPA